MANSDYEDVQIRFFTKRTIIPENPLLVRYTIFRFPWLGLYIHKLVRSDHDRALHDHPWSFISFIIRGYKEVTENGILKHSFGDILWRSAKWKHRVVIEDKPAWTIVLVGPRVRKWGFYPNGNFCWWRRYDTEKGICEE